MMRLMALLLISTMVHGAVTIKRVRTSGGDYAATITGLQDAVDDCAELDSTDPCIVDIEAGVTIDTGMGCAFVLPPQTEGAKMIVVRSSRISELPENVRVTEADAAKLAKIETSCSSGAAVVLVRPEITGTPGTPVASHYILQGIEAHYSGNGRNAGGAINIGYDPDTAKKARAYWQSPHAITVDRTWAHGNDSETWIAASGSTHANQHAIRVDGSNITVKNSRLSDNNMDNADHGQGESKGLFTSNGPGPLYVYNNYIDGAIGSLIGGEQTWIPGLVHTGSWFYGNEYTRDTWVWHWEEWGGTANTLNTSEPCVTNSYWEQMDSPFDLWKCVAGAWESTEDTRAHRAWTKNGWECKNCRLSFVEGNYIHGIPSTGDQSQAGPAFLLNNVDANDGAFHARPEFVSIRFNRAKLVGQGLTIARVGALGYRHTHDVTIEHNIFESIGGARVSPTQGTDETSGGGKQLQASGIDQNLRAAHNTFLYDRAFNGSGFRLSDEAPIVSNVYLMDSILSWADAAQSPLGTYNEACSAFRTVLTGAAYWDYIGLIDTNSKGSTLFSSVYGASECPDHVYRAANFAAAGFVSGLVEDGDYRLCTAEDVPHGDCTGASPWAESASDGGPLGADAQQVSRMTAGAVAGTYDPGLFNMQIRAYVGNDLRYTPYHPRGACTVTVRKGNTQTHSQDDEGLIVGERTMSVSTSGAGEYVARITCKDAAGNVKGWREFEFKRYN